MAKSDLASTAAKKERKTKKVDIPLLFILHPQKRTAPRMRPSGRSLHLSGAPHAPWRGPRRRCEASFWRAKKERRGRRSNDDVSSKKIKTDAWTTGSSSQPRERKVTRCKKPVFYALSGARETCLFFTLLCTKRARSGQSVLTRKKERKKRK